MELTDNFSWKRVWMLAKLYLPSFKKQLIVFPIFIICYTLIIVWIASLFNQDDPISPFVIFPIGLLFYLAPISLTRWNYYPISRQLPVKTSEKIVFLIGYYWILMFILTQGFAFLCFWAYYHIFPTFHYMVISYADEIGDFLPLLSSYLPYLIICNIFSSFLYQLPTLYGVLTNKQNRALYGFLWGFGVLVAFSFFCGIIGGIIGVASLMSFINENGAMPETPDQIVSNMVPNIITVTIVVTSLLSFALLLIFGTKIIKRLRTGGF